MIIDFFWYPQVSLKDSLIQIAKGEAVSAPTRASLGTKGSSPRLGGNSLVTPTSPKLPSPRSPRRPVINKKHIGGVVEALKVRKHVLQYWRKGLIRVNAESCIVLILKKIAVTIRHFTNLFFSGLLDVSDFCKTWRTKVACSCNHHLVFRFRTFYLSSDHIKYQ